ncbi:hypothetical protein SAMD00019534_067470 [Acytostelium subglobosum LB1]|uniref:hypothetical protein n=1 Tax=Acytostelium subglobosum LB1 TaxID=1410327 RepID=UPI000644F07F|nr:hypothetical protein SAMD00019534_067470 [Acytostelium subglobosum LB1]GAM23572.1 hypothetical protein SAMD00019534_067470 [Acytostelium subglobosum LB1]|eukprot:XP_012753313.1 hypothetical protein SAMD00019534_067470 [Acytostelium subglobosum LB1]
MSNPTFYYFDGRGRGEECRLLLALAGTKYVDTRSPYPMEQHHKDLATFGQFPYYADDNITLSESVAIECYIADQLNLAGSTSAERAQILQFATLPNDFYGPYYIHFLANDENGFKTFREVIAPRFLNKLEAILVKNGGTYLVGGKFSWADVSIFNLIDWFHQQRVGNISEVIKHYPALLSFYKKIGEIPQLAEYLKNRSQSEF